MITAEQLAAVADAIESNFMAFAFTCVDPKCECKLLLSASDWAAHHKLMSITAWLRSNRGLVAVNVEES